ncbi:acetyl-CoA synthetase-like protein [Cytidiella melzeri]|nr:acetyl-CoA synthetase-like protein [Cytidiella melzeri]
MTHSTPLTVVEASATQYSTRSVFKIPCTTASVIDTVVEWESISYTRFKADIELHAKYWARTLSEDGLSPHSVVALWLGGMTYHDVLSIYGIMRAGYIPELFSLRLPNPEIVYELMHKADAKALIYDQSLAADVSQCPIPLHGAVPKSFTDVKEDPLPAFPDGQDEDIVVIYHTSGSTSGSPKLVRCSYRWFNCIIHKAKLISSPRTPGRQDVTAWMGSMCHIAQSFTLLGFMQHGSCTVQPTKVAFSSAELVDMITRCGLTRLNQFATFLSPHLRASRKDPELLEYLRGLDDIQVSGLALPHEDEQWALKHRIRLTNVFGNTECGAMLVSATSSEPSVRALQPISGTSYGFFPVAPSQSEAVHVDANSHLLELVILSESGDCPDPSLRAADGHYHTGDLFLEIAPGKYVSRGRDDDWIKSQNSLRCDTKAIEDNVRSTCGDLIAECIVVGNGRPSPALFVEPRTEVAKEVLKKTIVRRIRAFQQRRYLHEQITATTFVFVVPRGTLPRTATKGNIRRKAVEEAFKIQLDDVFGMSFD